MAVLLKDGSIFLHIPKTGGSWVTSVLQELDLVAGFIGHKHADVSRVLNAPRLCGLGSHAAYNLTRWWRRRLHKQPPKKPYIFCFVRHPLSWYESWFKYQSLKKDWGNWGSVIDPVDWHPNAILNGLGSEKFDDFMRNILAKRPGYVTELYGWYTTPGIVNFVGKQESLRDDLLRVLSTLGLPHNPALIREAPRVNVSAEGGLNFDWEPSLKAETEMMEHTAMIRYGYSRSPFFTPQY